mmetsp:Transcript_81653/g.144007  ORF Transcript_81653/g.144007 Transcript_81653/m.144007 type:complete len:297 (-) Transcript_81653:444-1334(-)
MDVRACRCMWVGGCPWVWVTQGLLMDTLCLAGALVLVLLVRWATRVPSPAARGLPIELVEEALLGLVFLECRLLRRGIRQHFAESFDGGRTQRLGHLNLEGDQHLPFVEWVPVLRHALTGDGHGRPGLNDMPRLGLHQQRPPVQLLHGELKPTQGLLEADLLLHAQVLARALKTVMILLLQHNDHISWNLDVRVLVPFPVECDLVVLAHALLYVHFKDLLFLRHAVAGASATFVLLLDLGPLSFTTGALGLHLLDHGAHLAHNHLDPCPLAVTAHRRRPLLLGATPLALLADDLLV